MNGRLLIDAIVRQVTVLIAQLSTAGGTRAPLAHVANQVFVELAAELHAQGVSRKVSADMFGMALRSYLRRLRRLEESATDRGRTLWEALLDAVGADGHEVARGELLRRFRNDDEAQVRAVLHDLVEQGVLVAREDGDELCYRAASRDELRQRGAREAGVGLDELLWAMIYRQGPLAEPELAALFAQDAATLQAALQRLVTEERVQVYWEGAVRRYRSTQLMIPVGASAGWEAAVLDHVQAMVQTICQRLRPEHAAQAARQELGGSTYSFDIWPGHPLEAEVRSALKEFRSTHSALRERVDVHNAAHGLPASYEQVVLYAGQSARACGTEADMED